MIEYALNELFWVFVVLGIPMLIAWYMVTRKPSQKSKDDQIFKTVEEFRDELR